MKANELRIGNRIKYSSFEGIKKELRDSYVIVDGDVLRFLSNFKTELGVELWYLPIELTEEILFKLNKNKVLKEFDELDINKVVFEFRNNKLYFTAGGGATLSDPIEYLHELQNFVFLFSKKELEINL